MPPFFKVLLISLGIFTLCLAGCTALSIGGCATLAGLAVLKSSNLPDYANAEELTKRHADDFTNIQQSLENTVSLKYTDHEVALSDDILAIITETNARDIDIYKKYPKAKLNGHITINNAGTGSLLLNEKPVDCLIFIIEWNQNSYFVCLRDSLKNKLPDKTKQ